MKRSTLAFVVMTAASAGVVLAVMPLEPIRSGTAGLVDVQPAWRPPTMDDLGLGNGWTQFAGLTSSASGEQARRGAVDEPPAAATVRVDGRVVGWVIPDSERVQALMEWETAQAEAILSERSRQTPNSRPARAASRSIVSRFAPIDESRKLDHDDPRLRVRSRPFIGSTFRKPAWLEAWGRTLDRVHRQQDMHRTRR